MKLYFSSFKFQSPFWLLWMIAFLISNTVWNKVLSHFETNLCNFGDALWPMVYDAIWLAHLKTKNWNSDISHSEPLDLTL